MASTKTAPSRKKIVTDAKEAPDKCRIAIGNYVAGDECGDDIWCNFTSKARIVSDIVDSLPREQQIELLRTYVSSDVANLEKLLSAMKLTKLRKVHKLMSDGGKKKKDKKGITKIRQYESTLTGNATLRDVDNMSNIFFQQQAEPTHNNFMNRFQMIHNGGSYPTGGTKGTKGTSTTKSIIPPRIVSSLPQDDNTKNILELYMITNETDYRVWKRIIQPTPDLDRKVVAAVKRKEFASDEYVKNRLIPFLDSFDYNGKIANITDANEKCRILENEIVISRKENQSYEFRTIVYILYKVLNLNKPHVKLL